MTKRTTTVPIFEPEVIAAKVRLWHGDDEKVATTSLKTLCVNGVTIESRYGKANEYQLLSEIIAGMSLLVCSSVVNVFCDSKATWVITVSLQHGEAKHAKLIGDHFSREMLGRNGGHNGIFVTCQEREEYFVDPDWDDRIT